MGVSTFDGLASHIGHRIVCVAYGREQAENVAVECETCNTVLLDFEREDADGTDERE
jgi:hypothetical protein